MDLRKFITFSKILALLLLISTSANAKSTVAKNEFNPKKALNFNKDEQAFHRNMLQPQTAHISVGTEDSVKPINSGYFALLLSENVSSATQYIGHTNEILQDANRCESVSKLLFPFHYFW